MNKRLLELFDEIAPLINEVVEDEKSEFEPGEYFSTFIKKLSPKAQAAMMMQFPIAPESDPYKVNKVFAAQVAETFGPEWAQSLYHFAVLVTRIA